MANKQQLLVFTRFYKGENECPARFVGGRAEDLWSIERDWVSESLADHVNAEYAEDYIRYVKPKVPAEYGIPISLLAYIFHRLGKYHYSIADWGTKFTAFIKDEYLA